MKRFKNILCYTRDGSGDRHALAASAGLATRNQARLTVATVVEELPRDLMRFAVSLPAESLRDLAIDEARGRLAQFVAETRIDPPPVLEVHYGKPFVEICRAVQRHQHDLVVMETAPGKGLRDLVMGGTGLRLMRKCPCPVWVINPTHATGVARILAAVDPDPLDVVREDLNTKIMELATSMAALDGSELHVVHAWQALDQTFLPGSQTKGIEGGELHWTDLSRAAHQRLLDELLARFELGNLVCRTHLIEGEAGVVIPELVANERIDLIVMGTVARVGLEGFFIGNTAETVLNRVTCSLLTVKPEGFVSPVKLG